MLGVRAEFSIWRVPHHDSGYTGEVAARADIEGINVTYRLRRDMDGNGYWGSLGSSGHNELAPLQPHADERRGYHYEWQLSHDLESFGAALLEAEERARKTAESEAVKEANMRRRYPNSICPVRPARGFLVQLQPLREAGRQRLEAPQESLCQAPLVAQLGPSLRQD